jgi:hypothetical protein
MGGKEVKGLGVLVLAMAVSVSACGTSATRALATAACIRVNRLTPLPAPTTVVVTPGKTSATLFAFSWPSGLIIRLEHSGDSALAEVGHEMVAAAQDGDAFSANTLIARAKAVCHSLAE